MGNPRKDIDENARAVEQLGESLANQYGPVAFSAESTGAEQSHYIYEAHQAFSAESSAWLASYGTLPTAPTDRFALTVFNDYMQTTGGSTTAVSYPVLDNVLAMYDQLAIQVSADDVVLTPISALTLTVQVQHSADGINWLNKSATPEVTGTLDPIGVSAFEPGFDGGLKPTLGFARLLITIVSGNNPGFSAHVKISVTCNDFREADFSSLVHHRQALYTRMFRPIMRAQALAWQGKNPNPDGSSNSC